MQSLRGLPTKTDPLDALRTAVSDWGALSISGLPTIEQSIAITARFPLFLAAFNRLRHGQEPVESKPELGHAANYLYLLTGKEPKEEHVKALNSYMVLLADHGMNASTFTARIVASTESDIVSALIAGIGALKGPLHGGAPSKVQDMVREIGTEVNAEPWLRNAIAQLRIEVSTLKKFSFLIGATDPYIVIPGAFAHGKDAPKVGDYAVVMFADAIYPAIVGDIGPNDKVGEASLRIAKQINALSTPYNRPVSDLKATYLIFPETADKPFGPPDLDKIQARCQKLVDEIGGATVPLHHWENIIPPSPTPTPVPQSSPTPSPSPTPTTSPSAPVTSATPTFAFPTATPSP